MRADLAVATMAPLAAPGPSSLPQVGPLALGMVAIGAVFLRRHRGGDSTPARPGA